MGISRVIGIALAAVIAASQMVSADDKDKDPAKGVLNFGLTIQNTSPAHPLPAPPPINWFVTDPQGFQRPNWEAQKQQWHMPTNKIVFFHTGDTELTPENAAEVLSALGYARLYAPRFNSDDPDPYVKGQQVWSGHVRNGKQVFYQYHWIIFPDGTKIQLLYDDEVPWACGNWWANCEAIAIAFVGDFSDPKTHPTDAAKSAAAGLLNVYAHQFIDSGVDIQDIHIYGHSEVRSKGAIPSPGPWFYSGGRDELIQSAGYISVELEGGPSEGSTDWGGIRSFPSLDDL